MDSEFETDIYDALSNLGVTPDTLASPDAYEKLCEHWGPKGWDEIGLNFEVKGKSYSAEVRFMDIQVYEVGPKGLTECRGDPVLCSHVPRDEVKPRFKRHW